MSGYQKFGMWVLTVFLLAIAVIQAQDPWSYSEADLRIAEKLAIPYYRRHPGEYPDIDIASMMRQRGIIPRPYRNRQITTPVRESNHMQSAYDGFRKSILQKSLVNQLEKPSRYNKKSYGGDKYNKYGNKQKKQAYWWKF